LAVVKGLLYEGGDYFQQKKRICLKTTLFSFFRLKVIKGFVIFNLAVKTMIFEERRK